MIMLRDFLFMHPAPYPAIDERKHFRLELWATTN